MPKYIYRCIECDQVYEIVHGFNETIESCGQINDESKCDIESPLERIPQNINYAKKIERKPQAGQVVNEFIKNTKKDIREYKKEMKDWKPKK
tara:strand:- start:2573 stop:2848 length:276 start_codon:yes stop_codon:yes gene_type:complete